MRVATGTEVPLESQLRTSLASADFFDAHEAPLADSALSPAEIFLQLARSTPPWVTALMSIRNQVARWLGLKDVGHLSGVADKRAEAYQLGDRIGIFNVVGKSESELLLGIDDSHLDVRVSILKSRRGEQRSYVVSTVVKVHNRLGHVYMVPVRRIHPLVVRAQMRRAKV